MTVIAIAAFALATLSGGLAAFALYRLFQRKITMHRAYKHWQRLQRDMHNHPYNED